MDNILPITNFLDWLYGFILNRIHGGHVFAISERLIKQNMEAYEALAK